MKIHFPFLTLAATAASLFLLTGLVRTVSCENYHTVHDAAGLIKLSQDVSSGTNFLGTTVLLDADIDLSNLGDFSPVGLDSRNFFAGTFDGQGYAVIGAHVNTQRTQYGGLFGYTDGAHIKNIVVDASCTIENSYSSMYPAYTSGILGICTSKERSCTIENSVSMAVISMTGTLSYGGLAYVGGIIGHGEAKGFESRVTIKNCVNYGAVKYAGSGRRVFVGGAAGSCTTSRASDGSCSIQNCANFGETASSGTVLEKLYVGGIIGYGEERNVIMNCVNTGTVITGVGVDTAVGGIAGGVFLSKVTNCYTANGADEKVCGEDSSSSVIECSSFDNATLELATPVTAGGYTGKSLLDALNAGVVSYPLRDYSRWVHNKNTEAVSFTINSRARPLTLNSRLILLPSLASEGQLWFDGWYTDAGWTEPLTETELTDTIELYGKWEENKRMYTVSFDSRGGTPVETITGQFGSVVRLSVNTSKAECEFLWWESDRGDVFSVNYTVSAHDVTLYAVWACTHITTADEFVKFGEIVNAGVDFKKTTVYLDTDIDLSNVSDFSPIGVSDARNFRGTFDGQGHTISNLVINITTIEYAGLFGFSYGTVITDIVMDSTCTVRNSRALTSGEVYIGSIFGWCYADNEGPCKVLNTVNMANVTYSGYSLNRVFIGGILGWLHSAKYDIAAKNCANYGTVAHAGTSGSTYLGGITGKCVGSFFEKCIVENSLNYGSIVHSGTTTMAQSDLIIGGVVGSCESKGDIQNCLSGGLIAVQANTSVAAMGAVVGYFYDESNYLTHCLWTNDLYALKIYGGNSSGSTVSVINSKVVSLNTTTLNELNRYAEGRWSKWVILHLNGGSINGVHEENIIVTQKHFPDPTMDGKAFLHWCTDPELTVEYDPATANITAISDVFAKWGKVTFRLTFDFENGTVTTVALEQNETIEYPAAPVKEGYVFSGWCTSNKSLCDPVQMPGQDVELHPQWTKNTTSESSSVQSDGKGTKKSQKGLVIGLVVCGCIVGIIAVVAVSVVLFWATRKRSENGKSKGIQEHTHML